MPAAHAVSALADHAPRLVTGDGPADDPSSPSVAGMVGTWRCGGLTEPVSANDGVKVGAGWERGQEARSGRRPRPRITCVGPRLSEEGSPSWRAWASCLTLADLEGVLRKAVA